MLGPHALALSGSLVTIMTSESLPFSKFDSISPMDSEVMGSKPAVGSSRKIYSGSKSRVLAMANLFCIPPEISCGNEKADC